MTEEADIKTVTDFAMAMRALKQAHDKDAHATLTPDEVHATVSMIKLLAKNI